MAAFKLAWLKQKHSGTYFYKIRKAQIKSESAFKEIYQIFKKTKRDKMSEEEECAQLQEEETEVLTSIYEGDPCFSSEPEKKCYNYKFGQVT